MSFYQITILPKNSIHGTIYSSSREEQDCVKAFLKLRQDSINNGDFERDINDNRFETKDDKIWYGYNRY